jgi:flagellar assembly factor FliW
MEGSVAAMQIATFRFGPVEIRETDVLLFPAGLPGMEGCQRWVLLADAENDCLGWLQSTQRPEVALAVVSPRRFVADYQVRVARRELEALCAEQLDDLQVLVIVGKSPYGCTLNLKAPLVFHLGSRLGAQVVAKDDHPLQYELPPAPAALRKSA